MTDNAKYTATLLPHRGLIAVEGEDRVPFLQNLVTADLNTLPTAQILYSCLLTAQGKFLHDFFLHHTPDAILIDCEGGPRAEDLHKRLSLYRLRAKIKLTLTTENPVYAVTTGGLPDPRHPALPNRSFSIPENTPLVPFSTWDEARIKLTIPDGSRDIALERDTLLDCNIDKLNGVSFSKGCYVGQEITARMNYRGLAKKHLHSIEWLDGTPPAPFTDLHHEDSLIGQIRSSCGPLALAQLRTDALPRLHNAPFRLLSDEKP